MRPYWRFEGPSKKALFSPSIQGPYVVNLAVVKNLTKPRKIWFARH